MGDFHPSSNRSMAGGGRFCSPTTTKKKKKQKKTHHPKTQRKEKEEKQTQKRNNPAFMERKKGIKIKVGVSTKELIQKERERRGKKNGACCASGDCLCCEVGCWQNEILP